jgi:hypothetical protein
MEPMLDLDDLTPDQLAARAESYGLSEVLLDALVSHPQMPIRGLLSLASRRPEGFARNPTVRLLLATDPDFFKRIPNDVQEVMIRQGLSVGRSTIDRLSRDRSASLHLRVAAASSCLIDVAMGQRFLRHALEVRQALAENPRLPAAIAFEMLKDRSTIIRAQFAERVDLEEACYLQLATDTETMVLWTLAGNTACPREVHRALSSHPVAAVQVRAHHSAQWPIGLIPEDLWLSQPWPDPVRNSSTDTPATPPLNAKVTVSKTHA